MPSRYPNALLLVIGRRYSIAHAAHNALLFNLHCYQIRTQTRNQILQHAPAPLSLYRDNANLSTLEMLATTILRLVKSPRVARRTIANPEHVPCASRGPKSFSV